jgi:hypothetical protein
MVSFNIIKALHKKADNAKGGFVRNPSQTSAGQQSVTKYMVMIVIILVTPKA